MTHISAYIRLMRLDKPIGIWLLFWPCMWGLLLANQGMVDLSLTLLFLIGSLFMRSAGCVVNDIIDRKIDSKVARTKTRPIAAGDISVKKAILLTIALIGLSGALVFYIAPVLIPYSAMALLLVITYPFMKRITWWPQAFLGLTFNLGILFGWLAINQQIGIPAILLYIAGICWTIGYDTIYAHQDIEDDMKIGVKSTAIRFGDKSKQIITGFYFAMLLAFASALYVTQPTMISLILLLPALLHLLWQIRRLDTSNPAICLAIFKSNQWLGGIIAISIALTYHI